MSPMSHCLPALLRVSKTKAFIVIDPTSPKEVAAVEDEVLEEGVVLPEEMIGIVGMTLKEISTDHLVKTSAEVGEDEAVGEEVDGEDSMIGTTVEETLGVLLQITSAVRLLDRPGLHRRSMDLRTPRLRKNQ